MAIFDFLFGRDEKKKTTAVSTPATPAFLTPAEQPQAEPIEAIAPGTGTGRGAVVIPTAAPGAPKGVSGDLPTISSRESEETLGDMKRQSAIDAVHKKIQEKSKQSLPRGEAEKLVDADPNLIEQHFKQFGFTGQRKKQLQRKQLAAVQKNLGLSFETSEDPVTGDLTVDDDVKEEVINAFFRRQEEESEGSGGLRSFGQGLKDEALENINFLKNIGQKNDEIKRLERLDADTSDLYKEFIRTIDPAEAGILDQYGQADTSLARGAGRLTAILGTAFIPGGAAAKTVRAIPMIARLRQGTRIARLSAIVMENVAFDLTAQGFFSIREGDNLKEFTRNIASNPSMLLPYHKRWNLVAGFAADIAVGKALGLSTEDALQNATIGAGAGFLQRFQSLNDLGLRQLRNQAKQGMDNINAVARTQNAPLSVVNKMQSDLVSSLEKEARLLGFKPGETGSAFGEKRLLKLRDAQPGGQNIPDAPQPKKELPDGVREPVESAALQEGSTLPPAETAKIAADPALSPQQAKQLTEDGLIPVQSGEIDAIPEGIPQQELAASNQLMAEIFPSKKRDVVTTILTKEKSKSKRGVKELIGQPEKVEARRTAEKAIDTEQVGQLKDIRSFTGGRFTDIWNNTKKVFGDKYPQVKRALLDPFDKSKSERIDFLNTKKSDLKKNVTEKFNIKRKSRESRAIQEYGELARVDPVRRADIGEDAARAEAKSLLVDEFGAKRANELIQADTWFRGQYDQLLDDVNASRAKIYPNKTPIPRLDNYYRHFQEISGTLSGIKNAFASPANIDPKLVGISEFTTPKTRFLSFGQKRKGDVTELDAVSGFLQYIESSSYALHIDPHVNKFHAFRQTLADATTESKNLNNYNEFLFEFANDLAGKTNPIDRAILKVFGEGARKWINVLDASAKRVRANTILGNAKSAFSQVFNLPQAIAETKPRHLVEAMFGSFRDVHTGDPIIAKADFLNERYANSFYEGFEVGMLENVERLAKWMLKVGDQVATTYIWRAKYAEGISKNVADASKYANDATRNLVAGRGVGEVPLAQKSKIIKLIAPFQLEVGNAMRLTVEKAKNKEFKQLATLLIVNSLMNEASEKITGGRVVYDPINALMESIQNADNDDSLAETIAFGITRQAGEFLSNIPLGQTVAQVATGGDTRLSRDIFGEGDPGRFGPNLVTRLVKDTLKTATTLVKEGDITSDKSKKALQDSALQLFTSLGTPFGGNQIKKSLQGAIGLEAGEVRGRDGKTLFDIDTDSPTDILKTLIFGKYSTKEAREFFRSKDGKEEQDALEAIFEELFKQSTSDQQVLDILGIKTAQRKPIKRKPIERKQVTRKRIQRKRI